jgi:hypothetical protein
VGGIALVVLVAVYLSNDSGNFSGRHVGRRWSIDRRGQ